MTMDIQGVQAAIAELERGCKLYHQWYATGKPPVGDLGMAYEMVSYMRQALHKLHEEEDSE